MKESDIQIDLPYPPTLNKLYPSSKGGRRFLSGVGKAYKREVLLIVKQCNYKKIQGRIKIDITAYPPDNRKRDLDNIVKIIFDSLDSAGLFDDDSQIDEFSVKRGPKIKNGGVNVRLSSIN